MADSITTNFLDEPPAWANKRIKSWTALQPFVVEREKTLRFIPIDPKRIAGFYRSEYAGKTWNEALASEGKMSGHRRFVKEDPTYSWDTKYETRRGGHENWTAYDVEGELYIDGDGTHRSILSRFVAEENSMGLLSIPNYQKVKIDWNSYGAYQRIRLMLEPNEKIGTTHREIAVIFSGVRGLKEGPYDIAQTERWFLRRAETSGLRKYLHILFARKPALVSQGFYSKKFKMAGIE